MEKLYGDAIKRVARGESRRLLNDAELQTLADMFAKVLATGELLGRATVRNQLNANQRGLKFADEPPDLSARRFLTLTEGGPIPLMTPVKALEYFSSLVPGVTGDPGYYADTVRRKAFTLAVTTNETVLKAVQKVITDSLATGTGTAADIADILSSAGISSRNPQYAEMVFRTNMMTSYMQGHEQERRDPEVVEFFPVWSWDTIMDGRERPTHGARNGKYYPAHVSFQEVRGDPDPAEICNCRCISKGVWIDDWLALQAAGAQMETTW